MLESSLMSYAEIDKGGNRNFPLSVTLSLEPRV